MSQRIDQLIRIAELCRSVEVEGIDPFEVNVTRALETLRKHLPALKIIDELLLDVEALNLLASIIRQQGSWLQSKASSLYLDPDLVELKVKLATPESLSKALLASLRPIITLDQVSPYGLRRAMDYWNSLLPLSERFRGPGMVPRLGLETVSKEDMIKVRILTDREFGDQLGKLLAEIRSLSPGREGLDYWSLINKGDWEEIVGRAYLLSFLVSDGKVELKIDPIEETIRVLLPEGVGEVATEPKSVAVSLSPLLGEAE